MKKLIKLKFDNTTKERKTEDSYSELYSHDKNNGSFEFEILNETLTTEQVIALFKFTESNKIWKTTGTVEGNKVKVTFDTSLITQNETVICYLYFDEEQRTSDTFRFKFKVKVSEIDKMSRYEVKERFINNTVIVDRLDVVTKDELKEALKNVGGIATEGLLTEVKAEELYAKKSEAVDNTNFELVKNRVLALELKTDKDTVYDDSELKGRISVLESREDNNTVYDDTNVRERLTALESKPSVDISNLATKEELQEVRNSQPTVDTSNLVTRDELTAKNYLTEHQSLDNLVTKQELEEKHYLTSHQDLSEYAKKTELYNDSDLKARVEVLEQKTDKDTIYDDAPLKERVTALESKAIEGGTYDDSDLRNRVVALETKEDKDTKYDDTEVKRRLTELEGKPVLDTSVFVTEEKLNEKGYLTQHQSLENVVTKEELNNKHYVTEEELNNKAYLTSHQDLSNYALKSEIPTPYNDSALVERVATLESRPTTGGSVDTSNLVTKDELNEKENSIYDAIQRNPLYKVYTEGTLTEHLNNDLASDNTNVDLRGGSIFSNVSGTEVDIFKGDVAKEKFVSFQTAMFTLANSIPDNYSLYDLAYQGGEAKKVTFLSNKNFSEVVPKEELKAIIRETGVSTGESVDTSNFATKEELAKVVTKDELASKNYLTEHQPLTEVNNRLDVLEAKQDRDTVYNDSELRERVTNLENKPNVDLTNYVTSEQLENKHYLTQHQSLDNLVTKEELSTKGYITEEILNGKNYLTEDVLNTKNYLTQHQDLSSLVTKQELENKHYLTEHQPLTHLATTSDLEALRNISVNKAELSKKLDTTEFNSFKDNVVTKTELAEKGYISDLSNYVTKQELHEATEIDYSNIVTTDELEPYAKKSELPQPYNDAALVNRVSALENKQDKDTVYNDTEVKQRLTVLENKLTNQWEIHGTGMPNGVVEAELGTTYVDKNKTNGALKWIKTTDGGNAGWKVFTGDTGWRTLPLINKRGNARLQIRRINDEIIVKFDGLSWGWFGVDDLSKQGGNIVDKTIAGKQYTWIKLNVGRGNDVLPEGFRSASSLLSGLYGDLGDLLGSVYVGGTSDSNAIQLRYAVGRNELTSTMLSQIRISPITFVTDDGWPTKLP